MSKSRYKCKTIIKNHLIIKSSFQYSLNWRDEKTASKVTVRVSGKG